MNALGRTRNLLWPAVALTLLFVGLAWERNVAGWGCAVGDSGGPCSPGITLPGGMFVAVATVVLLMALVVWIRGRYRWAMGLLAVAAVLALVAQTMGPAT